MRVLVSLAFAAWLVAGSGWLLSRGDGQGLQTLWPTAPIEADLEQPTAER